MKNYKERWIHLLVTFSMVIASIVFIGICCLFVGVIGKCIVIGYKFLF